jgi:hypothetical protein
MYKPPLDWWCQSDLVPMVKIRVRIGVRVGVAMPISPYYTMIGRG